VLIFIVLVFIDVVVLVASGFAWSDKLYLPKHKYSYRIIMQQQQYFK